jgi:hypothetical protein
VISARPAGLEPATGGLEGDRLVAQSEGLREVASQSGSQGVDRDPGCFSLLQDDSSRNVTAKSAERTDARDPAGGSPERVVGPADDRGAHAPTTSDQALRLAIKLAVDAGEYERAATLVEVARRMATKPARVTTLAVAREPPRET